MRSMIVSLMIGFGLCSAGAQTGWVAVQPAQPAYLSAVHFVDSSYGWIAGGSNVSRSTDGGMSYSLQSSIPGKAFRSVHFTDRNNGWAAGDTIIHSTNGGISWDAQTVGEKRLLTSVYFIDANNGWTVGDSGSVYRTTNGGAAWTRQTSNTTQLLYSVFFIDGSKGWATGWNGTILRTTSGGSQWTVETQPLTGQLNSVHFIDANNGWIAGLSRILHTTNGGASWEAQTLPSNPPAPDPNFYCVWFVDANNGWISGGSGGVLSTQNGGATWILQALVGASFNYSIQMYNRNIGWLVGGYRAYYTRTGGVVLSAEDPNDTGAPRRFTLSQNYPNPFNPTTTIRFVIPRSSDVRLSIYDMLGREVSVLVNEKRTAGVHEVTFDGAGLSSGVYCYRLQAPDCALTRSLILLK